MSPGGLSAAQPAPLCGTKGRLKGQEAPSLPQSAVPSLQLPGCGPFRAGLSWWPPASPPCPSEHLLPSASMPHSGGSCRTGVLAHCLRLCLTSCSPQGKLGLEVESWVASSCILCPQAPGFLVTSPHPGPCSLSCLLWEDAGSQAGKPFSQQVGTRGHQGLPSPHHSFLSALTLAFCRIRTGGKW